MGFATRALALLLAAVGSTSTYAQTLTEHQFVEDSLKDHPAVAAAEAKIVAAAGGRRQAGVFANPELAWEREDPDLAARQDTWRLSWRLPFDGRTHRVAEADAAVAASQAMLDATRLDLRLEMRELFAAWYVAAEREKVLKGQLDTTRRFAGWMRARAEQGEAAGVDARRLELEVEVLSRQHAEASAEARARRAAAATWSDLVTGSAQPGRPALAPPPSAIDISRRPDLEALGKRVVEAEARHELKKRMIEPPELSIGWLQLHDATQTFDGPVFGVTWPVPIFDRNQGRRQTAAAEADRFRAELETARRRAVQHAEAAFAAYSELYRVQETGSPGTDVVDSVVAAFEAGEASLTDVLDCLRTMIDVHMARLDSLAAALAAERSLEAAVGHPILPGGSS